MENLYGGSVVLSPSNILKLEDIIYNGMYAINMVDINGLIKLRKTILEFQSYYMKHTYKCYGYDKPFNDLFKNVSDRISEVNNIGYNKTIIHLSEDEKINNYNLYNCNYNLFDQINFLELCELWNSSKNYTWEEFYKIYDEKACSEWNEIDENGNSIYSDIFGYWDTTRKRNGELLYNLPYSKDFILKTIDIGCNTLNESVRFSNFLCIFMERKIKALETYKNKY